MHALVAFFHPHAHRHRAIVDSGGHYHAASGASRGVTRVHNFVAGDGAVFARRSPILVKGVVGVAAVLLLMLLPVGIGLPYGVSAFVILVLNGAEKLVGYALFGPEAQFPKTVGDQQQNKYNDCDDYAAALGGALVVGLGS